MRQGRPQPNGKQKSVAQINAELQVLGQRFLALSNAGNHQAALDTLAQAAKLAPNHPTIMGDQALCHLRLKNYAQAREGFAKAAALSPDNTNLWDGLTETCGALGLPDEVRQYGVRALAIKDAQTQGQSGQALPAELPAFSNDRTRNAIAFSLFGDNPKYCETAVMNVHQAELLMPQWHCRFYVDASVPEHVLQRLRDAGATVLLVSEQDQAELSGLMWRFLVMEDPSVDRFLLRDADSLISTREAAAVDAWLQSGKWFHLMRDYYTHTELLLAGMWAGCTGVFKNLRAEMVAFIRDGKYLGQRVVDQHFLRAVIWPTVRQSLLSHDSVFGFYEGQDFPAHAPHGLGDDFHVGCNLSSSSIGNQTALPDGARLSWILKNEQGEVVCSYATPVRAGHWSADLPMPYIDNIKAGTWHVEPVQ
jgi:tetratricopeptide (TPR) repeat protein